MSLSICDPAQFSDPENNYRKPGPLRAEEQRGDAKRDDAAFVHRTEDARQSRCLG